MKLKLVSLDGTSIWMLFMRDGGSQFQTWFSSPPSSIDHVDQSYIENRLRENLTYKEYLFIKEEYKKKYQELMKELILSKEEMEFLKDLGRELKEQDNLGTAKPLVWQIREDKKVFGLDPLYAEDRVCIVDCEGNTFYTVEEAMEDIEDWHYSNDEEVPQKVKEMDDLEELFNYMSDELGMDDLHYTGYEETHEYKGAFLTRKAAEIHLKKNHYHYKNGTVYCNHGWRNPELKRLLEIVEKFADIVDGKK
ncbi:hypothetical protein [Orenia marismortui]|uniref:Uncharacterized protein n=1 Tax=Orenia marismortui TaxID=46469 RepID=A0A4R8GX35_9FIRM|nr:hypothetical protein [Orenia marismortui]TDX48300.1 hypothetical protein C7959_13027 [Orenia marismortui]